jgi:hypothetical protein
MALWTDTVSNAHHEGIRGQTFPEPKAGVGAVCDGGVLVADDGVLENPGEQCTSSDGIEMADEVDGASKPLESV